MIGTKDELIKFLLFVPCDGGIEVSIISDVDITEDLSPEFAEEITTLLEEEEEQGEKMIKPDELKLNQLVQTNDIIPGMDILMGDNMRFVGHSYHFIGDSGTLQSVNVYAKGFNIEDYEE